MNALFQRAVKRVAVEKVSFGRNVIPKFFWLRARCELLKSKLEEPKL